MVLVLVLVLLFSDLPTKWIESYGPQIAILKLKLLIILNLKPLLKNKHDCLYTQFWVQNCPFNSIYNFIYITTSSLFQIKQPMAQFYCTKCSRIKADGPLSWRRNSQLYPICCSNVFDRYYQLFLHLAFRLSKLYYFYVYALIILFSSLFFYICFTPNLLIRFCLFDLVPFFRVQLNCFWISYIMNI